MKCTRCEATVGDTWYCESCGTSDLCFRKNDEEIACLQDYPDALGSVHRLCKSCRDVGEELCTLRGIHNHDLREVRERLGCRYYCASCPLSAKGLEMHEYAPTRICPDIGLTHRLRECEWCERAYCDRCPCGCTHNGGGWRCVTVYYESPSKGVSEGERGQWATRDVAFSSVASGRREPRWSCRLDDAPTVKTGCDHAIRGDYDDSEAAKRRAIEDHRQALHIQAWDADLDYSATRCVHSVGLPTGVDPRDAARGRRTLLEHCLRRVAPLWARMSARERTSIPAELAEKVVALRSVK